MRKALFIIFCLMQLNINAQSWQDCSLPISNNLNAIQFIDNSHGWIVGDSGLILKYDNDNWISIESEFSGYNLTGLYFTDSIHGWIIGADGIILKYNNDTVSMTNSPTTSYLDDIYMINENYGWIGGNDRTILKYSENTWSIYNTDSFSRDLVNLTDLQFLDSTFGIFIGGSGDGGFTVLDYKDGEWYEDNNQTNTTWLKGLYIKDRETIYTSENQTGHHSLNSGRFINYNSLTGTIDFKGNIGYAAGGCEIAFGEILGWAISSKQIFKYEDEQFFLYKNTTPITNYLRSIYIENDSTGWIVGANGTILKYNSQSSNIPEIEKDSITVYPNPFLDYLMIKSVIPINYIEVFNTLGVKIETIKVYNESSIKYNCGNLPIGMYYLKIYSESSVFIQKVIKE